MKNKDVLNVMQNLGHHKKKFWNEFVFHLFSIVSLNSSVAAAVTMFMFRTPAVQMH